MDLYYLRKKLLYQSMHRGCKELDILLGNFAKKFLMNLDSHSIIFYEKLLNMQNYEILDLINQKVIIPKYLNQKVLQQIILFNNVSNDKKI